MLLLKRRRLPESGRCGSAGEADPTHVSRGPRHHHRGLGGPGAYGPVGPGRPSPGRLPRTARAVQSCASPIWSSKTTKIGSRPSRLWCLGGRDASPPLPISRDSGGGSPVERFAIRRAELLELLGVVAKPLRAARQDKTARAVLFSSAPLQTPADNLRRDRCGAHFGEGTVRRHIESLGRRVARLMEGLVALHPDPDPVEKGASDQARRELVLAQASDWPFMMRAGNGRLRQAPLHPPPRLVSGP